MFIRYQNNEFLYQQLCLINGNFIVLYLYIYNSGGKLELRPVNIPNTYHLISFLF